MLKSILNHTCPKCREGKLFLSNNPYDYKRLGQMPKECPVCNQSYSPEPGFYFGATYVSYAFSVLFFLIGFGINYLIFKAEFNTAFLTLSGIFVVLTPIVFRMSRTMWIHFFVRYDKDRSWENS
ncbi:MAG: DUF983 domain-containing protein [Bacteroidia bacterium]